MDGRLNGTRDAGFGEAWPAERSRALSKISRSSCRSSAVALVKRELGEVGLLDSNGLFAGVVWLRRALGNSGESERLSCSSVQHSFDAML